MLPLILGTVARVAGSALARGAVTRLGASAAGEAAAGRAGQFAGSALFNSAAHRQAERDAERADNPPDDDRR